jgi:hypothetical protein
MPNLGPGVPSTFNVAPAPTWVFTPNTAPTGGQNNVRFTNLGRFPVYIGQQGVNQYNGMPCLPGKTLEFVNVTQTLYAACPVLPTTAAATISATASTAASTGFTGATLSANLPAGTAFIVGSPGAAATAIEVLVVATSASTTSITTTTPSLYDHLPSSVFTAATYAPGLLQVTAGHN